MMSPILALRPGIHCVYVDDQDDQQLLGLGSGTAKQCVMRSHARHIRISLTSSPAWIVSSEQLLAWVRNPTPISQLDSFSPLKCSTPAVDSSMKICNGIPQNEAGLIELCPFSDFPFYTCVRDSLSSRGSVIYMLTSGVQYGCPDEHPSPSNPSPAQATSSAAARVRRKCLAWLDPTFLI